MALCTYDLYCIVKVVGDIIYPSSSQLTLQFAFAKKNCTLSTKTKILPFDLGISPDIAPDMLESKRLQATMQ
jgi:hypothetical protein